MKPYLPKFPADWLPAPPFWTEFRHVSGSRPRALSQIRSPAKPLFR